LNEQGVRQRRCGSSGAQRTEAIGVRTAAGSDQLHHRARSEAFARRTQKLRAANAVSERVTELEQILASVHVVDPPDAPSNSVTFGATVTVKDKKGATETVTIVGVDELNFERDAVSWISPLGKALLAADMGDWIKLDDGRSAKIVKIEFKTGQM
jgi:Transcription elongation factor